MATSITTVTTDSRATGKGGRRGRWLVAGLGLVLVLGAVAIGGLTLRMNQAVPADLDLATTRLSAQGRYRATIRPSRDPIPVNQLHRWTLHLETPDGRPVEGAAITIDGDMPGHGHGLPTRPQVARALGHGDYLIDGLKFHMHGWWFVEFDITADGGHDRVRFNLILK